GFTVRRAVAESDRPHEEVGECLAVRPAQARIHRVVDLAPHAYERPCRGRILGAAAGFRQVGQRRARARLPAAARVLDDAVRCMDYPFPAAQDTLRSTARCLARRGCAQASRAAPAGRPPRAAAPGHAPCGSAQARERTAALTPRAFALARSAVNINGSPARALRIRAAR